MKNLDALNIATRDTGKWYDDFPETCPWTATEILGPDWLPEEGKP